MNQNFFKLVVKIHQELSIILYKQDLISARHSNEFKILNTCIIELFANRFRIDILRYLWNIEIITK